MSEKSLASVVSLVSHKVPIVMTEMTPFVNIRHMGSTEFAHLGSNLLYSQRNARNH